MLRDALPPHYKYATLQLEWPKGPPEVDENEEIFINSYCIYYGTAGFAKGEDWYLGHHTREGKQLPGNKHYRTWKTIHVPEEPGSPLQPNKWDRLTELGLGPKAFVKTMYDPEWKIWFTWSPFGDTFGGIVGGWLNISIKLTQVEDLLK